MTDAETNAPQKYPSYKASGVPWLGEVPEHWETRRLKTVCRLKSGEGITSESIERSGKYPVYGSNGLLGHSNGYSHDGNFALIGRVGACGQVQAAKGRFWVSDNALVASALPDHRIEWLTDLLRAMNLNQYSVGTAQPVLTADRTLNLRVPVPPPAEQAAIVCYLYDADHRIRAYVSAKERLIALLEEEKQALIQQAVTRGLDPNVRLKPSGVEWLGDVPEHWEVRRAKYLYREADKRSETGAEQLMSVSHKTGVTPRKENVTMFLAESNIGHKLCQPGDIVINTMWAFMAALGVARQKGLVSPSYGVYRPHDELHLNHDYMDSLLRAETYRMNYFIRSTGITSSRLRLYPESFLGIPIVCPPRVEQDAIATEIHKITTSVDQAITPTQLQISLINEYRTRLIADVVTGKLDVREAAGQLPDPEGEDSLTEHQSLSNPTINVTL